jgi:hypothetical protein
LKERYKRREDEEEGISSYWMSIKMKRSWEFKEKALNLALWRTRLQNTIDMSQDGLFDDVHDKDEY